MNLQVIPLDTAVHEVSKFDCDVIVLNDWLKNTAGQHIKKQISQTFVLVDIASPSEIIGYYALAIRGLILTETLPGTMAKKFPKNAPALTLARLAVSMAFQKNGYGEHLLVDAMKQIKMVAANIGGSFLFVDAKDENAALFYEKYGFARLSSNPLTLVMLVSAIP